MAKDSLKVKKEETWYLSGPISGYPDHNHREFDAQEKFLTSRGIKVLNPCKLPHLSSWEACLKRDIKKLMNCEGVYVLKEWQCSRGAVLEVFLATILGMPIKDSYTLKPISHSVTKMMLMLFQSMLLSRKTKANI